MNPYDIIMLIVIKSSPIMRMRLEDKRTAIDFRIEGKSYREIRSLIPNLSKSTLSNWLRNVILTKEQEKRLKSNIENIVLSARAKSAWTNRQKNLERTKIIFEEAKKELPSLVKNPLFLIGLSLYWAEGSKTSNCVQFSNSDSRLIKIMLRWFKEICNIPNEKMKIHIYIHEIYKHENCEQFWSKVTNVPVSRFGKTTYKASPHKIKKNLNYKGVCRVDISNVNLLKRIFGWQQGVATMFEN